jgi:hypothetical protein
MAKTATISIGVNAVGDGVTLNFSTTPTPNAASPVQHQSVVTVNGANTLTPPTGALYCLIIPPAGSVITKTLKGDTGISLALAAATFLALASGAAAFVLTTNGIETIEVYWF